MDPYFRNDRAVLYHGDSLEVLKILPSECVHTVVTGPPYWSLRDYEVPPTLWSDGQCVALGQEMTPELFTSHMVEMFREVWRVLRPDGTLWINLGDTRSAERGGSPMPAETLAGGVNGHGPDTARRGRGTGYTPHRKASAYGLKHKELVGIPWRVAFALQADGWFLRSDIIWAKTVPMPQKAADRCTDSHEYIFMLTKQAEKYYWDQDAVRKRSGANLRSVWSKDTAGGSGTHYAKFDPSLVAPMILAGAPPGGIVLDPFAGEGTTIRAAVALDRRAIGIELNGGHVRSAAALLSLPGVNRRAVRLVEEEPSLAWMGIQGKDSL